MTTATRTHVGRILKRLRTGIGMTPVGVAYAMGWARDSNIDNHENGRVPVSLETACQYASHYGVVPSTFDPRLIDEHVLGENPEDGIGKRIRDARVDAALYQPELAMIAFGLSGRARVNLYEMGHATPCLGRIYAIAAACRCEPYKLDFRLTREIPPLAAIPFRKGDTFARGR